MPLLAIARVVNDEQVAKEKGWTQGLRIIDTDTEELRDVPNILVVEGMREKGIKIRNVLSLSMSYGDRIIPFISSKAVRKVFPILSVTNKREVLAENENDKTLFVTSVYETEDAISIKRLFRVCDGTGKNFVTVSGAEIGRQYSRIMNCGDREEFIGYCIKKKGRPPVTNLKANELMKRQKLLGINYLNLIDTFQGGVELSEVLMDMSGDMNVPGCVTCIGENAFFNKGIGGIVKIGDNVKYIDEWAFSESRLGGIEIGSSVEDIDFMSFNGCQVKGSLVVPSNIKRIDKKAFVELRCDNLVINCVEPFKWNVGKEASGLRECCLVDWYISAEGDRRLTICRKAAEYFAWAVLYDEWVGSKIEHKPEVLKQWGMSRKDISNGVENMTNQVLASLVYFGLAEFGNRYLPMEIKVA